LQEVLAKIIREEDYQPHFAYRNIDRFVELNAAIREDASFGFYGFHISAPLRL
jgi:hypothetical protein